MPRHVGGIVPSWALHQDKTNDNDKEKIERLTKELNTLKLAHETTLEDHRELLKTHEKLRFEKSTLSTSMIS